MKVSNPLKSAILIPSFVVIRNSRDMLIQNPCVKVCQRPTENVGGFRWELVSSNNKNDIHDIADRNTVRNDAIILKIQIINSPFSTVDDSFEIREKTKITGKKIWHNLHDVGPLTIRGKDGSQKHLNCCYIFLLYFYVRYLCAFWTYIGNMVCLFKIVFMYLYKIDTCTAF